MFGQIGQLTLPRRGAVGCWFPSSHSTSSNLVGAVRRMRVEGVADGDVSKVDSCLNDGLIIGGSIELDWDPSSRCKRRQEAVDADEGELNGTE